MTKKNNSKGSILVVDDTQQNVQILSQMLRQENYTVFAAFDGADALRLLEKRTPDLILLDVMMPGMNGFEVCEKIKSNPETSFIPVIFLSALSDTESKIHAFDAGGVDYITKPFQHREVMARVELHLSIQRLQNEKESFISQLQEKQTHLEQLNKEKDDVLAVISHDMRNPLGGIIGIVDLMRSEQITDTDELEEMLSLIDSSAQRLLHLVNDMLDVAVIESNRLKIDRSETDIQQLIRDVVHTHEPAAKHKGVDLIITIDDSLKFATIDKSKIAQVLGNLVSNAIKFTPVDGSVTIKASWSSEFDGFIVINVTDTGIGIPQSMMPVLFEKMGGHQRAGTQGEKGTGLGMPIIKRYVEAHGGVVDVESKEGKGTKFIITIPSSLPK